VDEQTFSTLTVIAMVAVAAPLLSEATNRRIPSVVLELGAGILIGPFVLDVATVTPSVGSIAGIGLTFLFFMAGYEINISEIKGRPLDLGVLGWFISLALAFGVAAALVPSGFALSTMLIGLTLTTTALGTLLPMLTDSGEATTKWGCYVLGLGAAGEFLPIVAIALLLTGHNPAGTSLLLVAFVALSAAAIAVALRPTPPRFARLLGRTMESSSQLPVRIAVLMIVLLVWIASALGLDVLLGAFAAGLVVRLANHGEDAHLIDVKLSALAFGLFVPVFFIVSGMTLDLDALTQNATTILRVPLFLGLFVLVRGVPTLFLYRRDMGARDRVAAGLLAATALPSSSPSRGSGSTTAR
jgi:Kef-type K+ transport system membrane component KefB